MGRLARCSFFPLLMVLLPGAASAIGLGELRGQPTLGERIKLEISLVGAEQLRLDAACFRLVQPSSQGDLPWLKKATLSVRRGNPPVLEVRSDAPLREPVLQVAVQLGCGHEISRDYMIMASPAVDRPSLAAEPRAAGTAGIPDSEAIPSAPSVPQWPPAKRRSAVSPDPETARRLVQRQPGKKPAATMLPDRLLLDSGDVGEPSLRLATGLLQAVADTKDSQREILRLEFRMLMALNEQAVSQMAAAEKLRNMEGTLGELQQRAADFVQHVEKSGAAPEGETPAAVTQPVTQGNPVPAEDLPPQPLPKSLAASHEAEHGISAWGFYGVLLGVALGLGGWLGWRNYRERQLPLGEVSSVPVSVPEVSVDPRRADEHDEQGGVDLPFEPAAMGVSMPLDLELNAGSESLAGQSESPEMVRPRSGDSLMSIDATTLDEHFEANPVMELADIMLSFGRVKGAAQALQEFIDNNPQEALQPWIRLMDVYRMAGMRTEFEDVARNLNQHFNVEVQSWDGAQAGMGVAPLDSEEGGPVALRMQSLEDLPRLMNMVVELWDSGDIVGYLYQLLRDNRGGQRQGFALAVVEDILFLIELKETANRMGSA